MAAPSCGKSGERDPDVVRAVDDVVGIQVDGAVDVARSVCVERTVENLITCKTIKKIITCCKSIENFITCKTIKNMIEAISYEQFNMIIQVL